jgi:hypothetical protein
MKIKFIPLSIFAIAVIALLSSESVGPAVYGHDCTGAEGTGAIGPVGNQVDGSVGCSNGGNCHNATTTLATTVELDSAGVSVSTYRHGGSYTIKITATNNTGHTLPKFGFQLATVLAASAGTNTAAQAGTWDSTSLPAHVQYTPGGASGSLLNIAIVEHSTQIVATSGTGANGTVYTESIPWTAPPLGTGSFKIYGALNAVVGNDQNGQDYYQAATPVTIQEDTLSNVGISEISASLNSFNVYPTLMNDNITISFDLKDAAAVNITLISMQGQTVKTLITQESLGTGAVKRSFDVNGLASGIYFVRLKIGNSSIVSKVVKE